MQTYLSQIDPPTKAGWDRAGELLAQRAKMRALRHHGRRRHCGPSHQEKRARLRAAGDATR
jgi:hypothetical protein